MRLSPSRSWPLILAAITLWLGGFFFIPVNSAVATVTISDAQAQAIGRRIWQNECGGTVAGLTSWNSGESFASLGINHYIWYPRGQSGPFEESFPRLLSFLHAHGVALPDWLRDVRGSDCPWNTRAEFQAELSGARLRGLRDLLARPEIVALQARFSAERLREALPKLVAAAPAAARENVRRQFERVAEAPGGIYALVDYVNFKGEGTLPSESYAGHGWGLLQVLSGMHDSGADATREFADSAARVLAERVKNSPPERHEARWLPGWTSRVRGYAR